MINIPANYDNIPKDTAGWKLAVLQSPWKIMTNIKSLYGAPVRGTKGLMAGINTMTDQTEWYPDGIMFIALQ